jgi:hypothetical protein
MGKYRVNMGETPELHQKTPRGTYKKHQYNSGMTLNYTIVRLGVLKQIEVIILYTYDNYNINIQHLTCLPYNSK